jgi:hypothetical protein
MKTFVITISKTFPSYHHRKGEPTYFNSGLTLRRKKTTIRGNYKFWKRRVDLINAGEAVLSVREWIGKPYFSKQQELMQFTKVGIQKCDVEFYKGYGFITIDDRLKYDVLTVISVITNDGLTTEDFAAWFKYPIIDGCILHFTELRY